MDLAAELDRMPGTVFARWLSMGATPPAAGDLDYQRPGAGSWATVSGDGIEITVSGPDFTRHGLVTWPQAASWIDKGVTPARLGIVGTASRLSAYVEDHRDQLAAAGTCDPGAVAAELAQIRGAALAAIVEAARRSQGTAVPVPPALPGDPAWHTAVAVTRPGRGPDKAENKALERLTALRSLVREPQPLTPQEVRDAIRREINLADVARAMGNPATMRRWINDQARRTSPGRYDDSGHAWRGTGPDGLTVDRHGDDRAPHVIPWDHVLAWVAPGLTDGLREELLAAADASRALMHREFGAVINPGAQAQPSAGERNQADRRLRAADAAAWAAIQAAPSPSPADFDRARYAARDTSPVQETLFGEAPNSAHADDAAPELPTVAQPGSPAPAAPEPGEPAPGTDGQSALAQPARAPEPAAAPQPASGPEPLNADDVFLGVSRLPSFVIVDLFHAADNSQPLESVSRQLPSHSGERAAGEPDAGARETVAVVPAGLRIEVAGPDGRRAGLVTWPQVDNLLRPGATPARRQIVTRAWQVNVSFMGANDSFRAVGEGSLAAAAEDELRALAATAVGAILEAVRPAGRARSPQPADEAAMTSRIAELAAALPARPRRPRTPAAEVTPGDVIGHHSYRFHPFLVTEPPRQTNGAIEITGRLTEPEAGEPAGPFILTVPLAGRQGAVVTVIPVPACSLRPLFPGHETPGRASQPAVPPGLAESTGTPSALVKAPANEPHATQPRSQEETMPPTARSTALPVPPALAEPGAAPQAPPAAPAPAPPGTGRIRYPGRGEPPGAPATGSGADGASLADELERLLGALRERRGAAGGGPGDADFSDIRAAFAAMRDALSLPAADQVTGPGQPAPALPAAPPVMSRAPRGATGPAADGSTDIREAFADLRDILGLPAQGRHARGDGPPDQTDAAVTRALDQAAAEAQACARWYRDAPEWQRTITVGRAARDLVTAIRDAADDYWAEIRQDIRVRGFARTLAARTALAVSGAAHLLADGLERAGHRDSRAWRAAWGLHRATTTFASWIMRYTPPGSPDRMTEARRIINDLGQQQRDARQPGPGRHETPRSEGGTRAPNAAALASASFPVMVNRANARHASTASAAPTAGSPDRQQRTAKR